VRLAGMRMKAFSDRDVREPVRIEMRAQRRLEARRVAVHRVADLAMRRASGATAFTGFSGRPEIIASTMKLFQP
jgi:hypothetical protein